MGILENLVDAVSESVKENFKESISDIFDNDKICLNMQWNHLKQV